MSLACSDHLFTKKTVKVISRHQVGIHLLVKSAAIFIQYAHRLKHAQAIYNNTDEAQLFFGSCGKRQQLLLHTAIGYLSYYFYSGIYFKQFLFESIQVVCISRTNSQVDAF